MKRSFGQLCALLLLTGFVMAYWGYIVLFVAVFALTFWWLAGRPEREVRAAVTHHQQAALASRADRQRRGDASVYGNYPPVSLNPESEGEPPTP